MEATLSEMQAFHVKMKVLRFAPFDASTSHVQSPTCVHENGKIHVAFVVGKRHSSKTHSSRANHDTHGVLGTARREPSTQTLPFPSRQLWFRTPARQRMAMLNKCVA